jgi:hypothetical protein
MGILNCSNKGPCPLQRGDNLKNAKMGWGHLKIFSRRCGMIKVPPCSKGTEPKFCSSSLVMVTSPIK